MPAKKQDGDTRKVILNEVSKLLRTIRPLFEPPPEVWEGYSQALDDLTAPEVMLMVSEALKRNWLYLPTPGELREIVMKMREDMPYDPPASCALCNGMKFRRVKLHGEGNYFAVVPCPCMASEKLHKHKAWLLKFNPEFVSKV